MPIRGVKVGDAFVEVSYDVETAAAMRQMAEFNAAASKMAKIDARVDTQGLLRNRQTFKQAAESLGADFEGSFNRRVANLGNVIANNTERERKTNEQFRREGDRAAAAFIREADAAFKKAALRGVGMNIDQDVDTDSKRWGSTIHRNLAEAWAKVPGAAGNARRKITQDIDVDSNRWGMDISRNMTRGVEAFASVLPGRMESLFSGASGPIGLAIGAALIGGVATAIVPIGAMLSGALFAAFGGGAVAAGIALVAKDPRVSSALDRLKEMFHNKVWDSKGAEAFVQVTVKALDKITGALQRWAPFIQTILFAASQFVGPLTDGLIAFVDGFLGPLANLMKSSFMKDIMNTFGQGMGKLGQAFGDFINRFLNDSAAQKGAVQGLSDLFDLLAWTIRAAGHSLAWLAAKWHEWSTDPDGPGPMKSKIQQLKEVFDRLKASVDNVWKDWSTDPDGPGPQKSKVQDLIDKFKELRDTVKTIADILHTAREDIDKADKFLKGPKIGGANLNPIKMAFPQTDPIGVAKKGVESAKQLGALLKPVWDKMYLDASNAWNTIYNNVSSWINNIQGWIRNFVSWVGPAWSAAWSAVHNVVVGIWQSIYGNVSSWINNIQGWINNFLTWVQLAWGTVWGAIYTFVMMIWNNIWAFVAMIVTAIWGWVVGTWNNIYAGVAGALLAIWNWIVMIWNAAYGFVAMIVTAIWGWVVGTWNNIYAGVAGALLAIWNWIVMVWNAAYGFVAGIVTAIWQWIVGTWNSIVNGVANALQVIWNFVTMVWNAVYGFIQQVIVAIGNWIMGGVHAIQAGWNAVWQAIADFFSMIWNAIVAFVQGAIAWVSHAIGSALELINSVWQGAWQGMHDFLGGIWNNIQSAVASGLNAVIDIINGGINAINGVLDKVGVSFRIPTLDHVGAPQSKSFGTGVTPYGNVGQTHADGGRIRGEGHSTQDRVNSWLSDDEFVMKTRSARQIGYRNLEYMNQTGMLPNFSRLPGFASGGRKKVVWVGAHGDNEGLMNEHQNHVHVAMNVQPSHDTTGNPTIVAIARKSGLPVNPVSGYRPGSRGSGGGMDHHSEGRATDFGGFNQDALAMYFAKTAGVIELIHRTQTADYGIFGGGGGGGLISLLNEWLAKGAAWVMDHMINPVVKDVQGKMPMNFLGQLMSGSIGKIAEGLKAKIQEAIDAATAAQDVGGGGGGPGAAAWSSTAAQALKMLGMPASWLSGVLTIIQRESGGNPNAINKTDSNAQAGHPSQGLMQTIPSTFAKYAVPGHTNITGGLDNILAALRYIVATYGSVPAVAGRAGGYKNGGMMYPGWNFTHEPEMALNSAQGKALEDRIRGGAGNGGHSIGELHIHIGSVGSDADAKRFAKQIRDELNKLADRNGGRSGLPGR